MMPQDVLFWQHALLHMQMLGIAILVGTIAWVIYTAPPSRYRAIRLTIAFVLLALSMVRLIISVSILGIAPI